MSLCIFSNVGLEIASKEILGTGFAGTLGRQFSDESISGSITATGRIYIARKTTDSKSHIEQTYFSLNLEVDRELYAQYLLNSKPLNTASPLSASITANTS